VEGTTAGRKGEDELVVDQLKEKGRKEGGQERSRTSGLERSVVVFAVMGRPVREITKVVDR
jgi:hypothetical protein